MRRSSRGGVGGLAIGSQCMQLVIAAARSSSTRTLGRALDKDVLTPLVSLKRIIEDALGKWMRSYDRDRMSAWALPFCACQSVIRLALIVLWLVVLPAAHADIYHWPATSDDGQTFVERADAARVPSEVLTHDPLAPAEPDGPSSSFSGFPRLRERPDWAPADTITPFAPQQGQIRVRARGGGELNLRMFPRGDERVWIINRPTQITIFGEEGPVEFGADRIVVWTDQNVLDIGNLGASNAPVELYMEGNIEFRYEGIRGLAERMYYNVATKNGVILEGELIGEVNQPSRNTLEDFRTPFRLKADVLRQFSPTQFQANNAAFTTSLMGVPRWWLESQTLNLDTGRTSVFDQLGASGSGFNMADGADPLGQFDRLLVSSENSTLYAGGAPIFRWPSFTTDLANNPSLYLDGLRVGSDGVFGQQILTRWNNFQLFGITPPANTKWTTNLDWLSDRGIGFGTDLSYQRDNFFGRPANSYGYFNSWFINDSGLDNLGEDRRAVPLEEDFRYRIYGRHRHLTPNGLQVTGEVGAASDRNVKEQYYEEEWDLEKDPETRLELKQHLGSDTWTINGNVRLNDFHTQTEWLPRVDHYGLGRSVFGNRFTWYEHSQIGYARLRAAERPTNSVDILKWDPTAWERDSEGIRAVTRQELDMPFQLGAMRVVPYVLGEAAHWQETLDGSDATRLLGQGGLRTSLPMTRIDPTIQNELFNLNGLAHKLTLESEFLWADSNQDYLSLPLYDPLDDDSIEFFRRRFLFDTFMMGVGDDVPLRYDERNFALRSGMQRSVAAPSVEIADDLMMFQLRARHRIQTHRGLRGRQRVVDWMVFDVESTFFPRADRDNFGQELGPTIYDFRWHVGDRTTILSDGYFDFFSNGLRTVSLGAALSRPGRSEYYVGIRSIENPISSQVLTTAVTYRLSPKWILNYNSAIDFSSTGNIGQSFRIVRVGESVLVALGAYYDASRDNLGLRFDISPRFIRSKLGMIGGRPIPPVGAFGLE